MSVQDSLNALWEKYRLIQQEGLLLNIERGQPGDENFKLSSPLFTCVDETDVKTEEGFDIRNYPGGVKGILEMRRLAAEILDVKPEETIVGNNSSLKMLSEVLSFALLKGLNGSPAPWCKLDSPKLIVTVPGYDRHFTLASALGFKLLTVPMTGTGPDVELVARFAESDETVKGIILVPTYANPTGETISVEAAQRLVSLKALAKDFTIFADEAYVVHHLGDTIPERLNLLRASEKAGYPNRVYLFSSTSKITFAGAGLGFLASSLANIEYLAQLYSTQYICPNKVEQYRHAKFLKAYPGGIAGLMREHAKILKPKFDAALRVLERELAPAGLATWTRPLGGYFISLNTTKPVAKRVVELAKEAGVSVTPAGATFPFGEDPANSNIRIAPTRPPLAELEKAMEVLCLCIKLASAEWDAQQKA